ncbi:MAG: adenylate/guanylate cyclase domain-containing protein [Candidatus Cloacimonetes bacterium]|nr:adenylate/guanylate cyclase domain-containing protein [Candidatus Cloacimonadota bacterium]
MKSKETTEYQKEMKLVEETQSLLDKGKFTKQELIETTGDLLKHYRKLLRQICTLTKVSDNQQHKLKVITDRLGRYVSYQLFKKITQGKDKVEIKTQRKKLTVFFSDVKDFSYISSHMEGEALSVFLNQYLDIMTKIVKKWNGTLDKYWGDAILAFWGDPVFTSDEDHALKCVSMAIEMKEQMRNLQKQWFEDGYQEPLHIRIGIASGFCTVGNFGSSERMDYTIIGNPVNFAARLESAAEPDEILISHETWGLVKDKIVCEPHISLSLKGFHQEMIAHKVLGHKNSTKENVLKIDDPDNGIKLNINFSKTGKNKIEELIKELKQFSSSS